MFHFAICNLLFAIVTMVTPLQLTGRLSGNEIHAEQCKNIHTTRVGDLERSAGVLNFQSFQVFWRLNLVAGLKPDKVTPFFFSFLN